MENSTPAPSTTTSIQQSNHSTLKLRLPGPDNKFQTLQVSSNELASVSKLFFTAFSKMMLSTRQGGSWNSDIEAEMLQMLLNKHKVTCQELYTAFFEAYSDHFTPQSGIEWRHLWKQISHKRNNPEPSYYKQLG